MTLMRKIYLFVLLLCMAGTHAGYAQCDTASAPIFSKDCFREYFTHIHATGDLGTTSTICVNGTSCSGTFTDLSATQGIEAPVGAHVYLHISRYTTHYTGYVSVYLDWDHDNVFDDIEHANWPSNPMPDVELAPTIMDSVYDITLFCGAPAGRHHMRVMLSEARNNDNAPCIGTYGQAYDFYFNSYCPNNTLTGDTLLCSNDTTTLTASYGCGAWASSNSAIVSVGSTGVIGSGTSSGTAVISYTSSACGTSSAVVSVVPTPIALPTPLCVGGMATATTWPADGTWSIGSPYLASISASGTSCDVTGVNEGSTVLTYTMGGCSAIFPVNIFSSMLLSGNGIVCLGGTRTLSVVTAGGTWTSSNNSVATVGTDGVVSGVAVGTVNITYQAPYGACEGYKTMTVEEITLPSSFSVCIGNTVTLTATPSGGTWALDPDAEGITLSTTGVLSGSYRTAPPFPAVTYTSPAGCLGTSHAHVEDRMIWLPGSICIGYSAQVLLGGPGMHGFYPGDITLSSSNYAVATVDGAAGTVTGVSAGTATITYTSPSGCIATAVVAVGTTPLLPSVDLCLGTTLNFSDDGPGTWSSSNTSAATVSSSGIVTGVAANAVNITFTPSGGGSGCAVVHQVMVLTPPTVSGSTTVCQGGSTTYTATGSSGYWSSSNTARATVSSAGVVTGISPGTATISYISGSCYGTQLITVDDYLSVSGCSSVCVGAQCTLTPASGMTSYYSTNTGVATVTDLGGGSYSVNGISAGTAFIVFGTGSCANAANQLITVHPIPYVVGPTIVCPGTTITMTADPSGGGWSSDNTAVLTVNSSTGVVSYVGQGWTNVDYVSPAGCARNDYSITAGASVTLSGSGALDVCEGTTVGFTATPPGGLWISSDPGKLSINILDGSAHSNSAGNVTLTYIAVGSSCTSERTLNVKPKPKLCRKFLLGTGGGGISGLFDLSWNLPVGQSMYIWASPAYGTGYPSPTLSVGAGSITTDATTWCSWSGAAVKATVTGIGPPGNASFTYEAPNGCSVSKTFFVTN